MEKFVKLITSPLFSLLWTTIVMTISIFFALNWNDPGLVASAGALITLAGILQTTRSLLVHGFSETVESRVNIFHDIPNINDPNAAESDRLKREGIKKTVQRKNVDFISCC